MNYTDEQMAGLEALLFIHGEPLSLDKIATLMKLDREQTAGLVAEYEKKLAGADRGLAVVSSHDRIQLVTKPSFGNLIETFVKAELSEDLTRASLETLAIIAYFGPSSRMRIDYQRGVNSQFILRSLLLRGLVDRYPDPRHMNSYLYIPSFDMLKFIGVSKQAELPNYEKFQALLARFETAATAEA